MLYRHGAFVSSVSVLWRQSEPEPSTGTFHRHSFVIICYLPGGLLQEWKTNRGRHAKDMFLQCCADSFLEMGTYLWSDFGRFFCNPLSNDKKMRLPLTLCNVTWLVLLELINNVLIGNKWKNKKQQKRLTSGSPGLDRCLSWISPVRRTFHLTVSC